MKTKQKYSSEKYYANRDRYQANQNKWIAANHERLKGYHAKWILENKPRTTRKLTDEELTYNGYLYQQIKNKKRKIESKKKKIQTIYFNLFSEEETLKQYHTDLEVLEKEYEERKKLKNQL